MSSHGPGFPGFRQEEGRRPGEERPPEIGRLSMPRRRNRRFVAKAIVRPGQHRIAKAIAGEMHVAAGWSLSASVDPCPNDFCVRGMAATGLVRSVRSVMVAQCSSRASA